MGRGIYGKLLRYGNLDDFMTLKPGNIITVGNIPGTFRCIGSGYFNHDSDDPSWEIETNNGIIDFRNDICVIR